MVEHTFLKWLYQEVTAIRCSLLALYEEYDRLQYIERPSLEREYMDKIGTFEETVIREEIEIELLQKKKQMIQTAINRMEPIDEAAIDAELDAERQKLYSEAAGPELQDGYANLGAEESDELQELYQKIVKNFHPQMHPEMPKVYQQLYQRAQEAYRRRDLKALRLIYDMLNSTEEETGMMEVMLDMHMEMGDSLDDRRDYTTDYSLAELIYNAFKPTSEEVALQEEAARYRQISDDMMKKIDHMRSDFPFTAAEMLLNPQQIEDYKKELEIRLHSAVAERERRTQEINEMLGSVTVHE